MGRSRVRKVSVCATMYRYVQPNWWGLDSTDARDRSSNNSDVGENRVYTVRVV